MKNPRLPIFTYIRTLSSKMYLSMLSDLEKIFNYSYYLENRYSIHGHITIDQTGMRDEV